MKNAVYTMVQNDMVILKMWTDYYKRFFDTVHVLCNGTKDKYIPIIEDMGVSYERLDGFVGNADTAKGVVNKKQVDLLEKHRWVLYTNCDEFLITDPRRYIDLKDFMNRCKKRWETSVGYEVIEWQEPYIDYSKPFMQQRKFWVKNINMNKTIIGRVPLDWNEGQHQIAGIDPEFSKKFRSRGLILVHIRHADLEGDLKAIEVGAREFGPMKTDVNDYVMTLREKARRRIPKWAKVF